MKVTRDGKMEGRVGLDGGRILLHKPSRRPPRTSIRHWYRFCHTAERAPRPMPPTVRRRICPSDAHWHVYPAGMDALLALSHRVPVSVALPGRQRYTLSTLVAPCIHRNREVKGMTY